MQVDFKNLEKFLHQTVGRESSPIKLLSVIHPFYDLRVIFKERLMELSQQMKQIQKEILDALNDPALRVELLEATAEGRNDKIAAVITSTLSREEKLAEIRRVAHCGNLAAEDILSRGAC